MTYPHGKTKNKSGTVQYRLSRSVSILPLRTDREDGHAVCVSQPPRVCVPLTILSVCQPVTYHLPAVVGVGARRGEAASITHTTHAPDGCQLSLFLFDLITQVPAYFLVTARTSPLVKQPARQHMTPSNVIFSEGREARTRMKANRSRGRGPSSPELK